jgi:hypothetical protein
MTNEQINAAIHAVLGNPLGCPRCSDPECAYNSGINYCADLNAMHEAEKVLTSSEEKMYFANLKEIVGDLIWYRDPCTNYRATARQRAEAFLRTLGKWSATDKDSLKVEATTEESSAVQSTSSGGSGGASTYGGKGLGIAGATWPPETRITVNGKTFCLADIDKEMTE